MKSPKRRSEQGSSGTPGEGAPARENPSFPSRLPALLAPAAFVDAARELGIEFDDGDLDRLGRYLALLIEVNKSHNLTAVTEPDEVWTRHILDSLTLLPLLAELPKGSRVIDVGSGGGLPGIPLAVCLPDIEFTLLEATGKKAEFLRHVAWEVDVANVEILQERAERAGQDHHARREKYDAAIARAVGPMSVLAELTVPFVKTGGEATKQAEGGEAGVEVGVAPGHPWDWGRVLLIKGAKAEEELAAAKQALRLLHVAHIATIPTPTGRIVVLEKVRKTPRGYPRPDGEPKRKPLGS